jgi:TonB family protein
MRINRISSPFAAVAFALALASPVAAQETLQQVKDLYASAAYEDALGVLSRLESPGQRLEIERYRVFCLIALDRPAEAEQAIVGMLTEDPLYTPEDASPRVVELFRRIKRDSAPQLAKNLYSEGKSAMERKQKDQAIRKFEQLLQLTDDEAVRDQTLVSELRLLAAGFLDLARSAPAAESATPAAGAPAVAAAPPTPTVVTPPVPVRQELPRWAPTDPGAKSAEYKGAVKVVIAADGKVESAEIVTPTDRNYDRMLLNAARGWLYEPAKRNGVPIQSEKIVSIHLRPR